MNQNAEITIGLGHIEPKQGFNICVYIANRPPMEPYDLLDHMSPMGAGEIASIAAFTGNHWRKIFNVYAKLMYEFTQQATSSTGLKLTNLEPVKPIQKAVSWQAYRDETLLQIGSQTALLFTPPNLSAKHTLHIIMGKGHGEALGFPIDPVHVISNEHSDFACYTQEGVIVCPYFDYRQLSNIKITALAGIMLNVIKQKQLGEK
ncbi:hypothetical protein NBRC116188_26420 [Oceaniserpentilla sp. 4NH20-0058]|uniref:DUF6942 family protein n=1 Tax=Oceaniserpentilla sp. 4NH20-0058 TaxID=3127660 RepID=UPI0031033B6B